MDRFGGVTCRVLKDLTILDDVLPKTHHTLIWGLLLLIIWIYSPCLVQLLGSFWPPEAGS
jgi:hypothetical protein